MITLNVQNPAPVKVEEDPLPYTDKFTYILAVLLDTTEEQEATPSTELERPGMPSGC